MHKVLRNDCRQKIQKHGCQDDGIYGLASESPSEYLQGYKQQDYVDDKICISQRYACGIEQNGRKA